MTHGFGGESGYKPCRERMSAKFKPAARTRTITSPSPGVGSGFSWTFSTSMSPVPVVTICRIDQYYQFLTASSVLICAAIMRIIITFLPILLLVGLGTLSCQRTAVDLKPRLTLAVVTGVEGDALKQAAH